jgi:glycine/D-amino acid oxidase-like deaminating enzyme
MAVGPEHVEHLRENAATVADHGYETSVLEPDELGELQPFWAGEGIGAVAWEPESGYADPVRTTLALLERGQELGLEVLEGAQAQGFLRNDGRVEGVRTNLGDVSADVVVLAGGAWSEPLLAELGVDVPVEAVHIGTCVLDGRPLPPAPPCCTAIDDTTGTYFRPDEDGNLLAGVPTARHRLHADVEPPALEEAELEESRKRIGRRIPLLRNAPVVGARSGFDAYTPDKHPLIGRADGTEGVYLAVAFGGGGFKVAPAVGEAVAAEIVGEEEQPVLEPFRPDRFGRGRPIEPRYPYTHS